MPKANLKFDSNGTLRLSNGLLLHNSGVARGEFRSLHADFFQTGTPINTGDTTALVENEEFAEFNFRMLSAVLIEGWWCDFRNPAILEEAVGHFATKIYTDHQRTVRNSIGITRNPVFTNRNNIPGVDAVFRIYKEFASDVIARLKTKPALIDANSVGISFTYEKSHPQLDNFYGRLGEIVEGEYVRLIPIKILSVPETSLVAVPADNTARKFAALDFPQSNLTNNQEDKMKIKRTILSLLGVDSQKFGLSSGEGESVELPSEKMESVLEEAGKTIAKLQDQARQSAVLQNNLNQFAKLFGSEVFPEGIDFASKVTELQSLLEEPKKLLTAEREKAVSAYRVFTKNQPDSAIETLIQAANLEQAKAFSKHYGASLENSHPLKCEDCGSNKVSRASGSLSDPQGGAAFQKKNPNSFKLSKK
ncbi:hypothetical protein [Leptospira borgpetersenii]|uniref:Uncharacterized protein n=2 Tax=Leptospira borgpetersenii TaxID=174 RepID=M3GWV0_LEPBO|nr:hypothetical protein [Leptospira borgpetersenii]EKP12739.1 hypothetical protein LEP1GSC128_3350 [Leptospira borgpetersenii str. 200801926]EMF99323.1 hypothetical protein LEP1GSC123_4698 [Leptospira borgpetersenii str. 200701203]ENO65098.1 hypothetical protein LEP1GSC191_2780 [Leptospira borgpetersenii serovar Mini str. 201000851]